MIESLVRAYFAIRGLLSAGMFAIGAGVVWMSYPPQGTDGWITLVVGGTVAFVGILGVYDLVGTIPTAKRDHSD